MMNQSLPYCGPAPLPQDLWRSWNLDPLLLLALAGFGVLLLARAAPDRRLAGGAGWAALAIAFVSPLCALTVALFSARAAHHVLILTLAAPALAHALPLLPRLPAGLSLAAVTAAMVAWHLPQVYTAAWGSDLVYWALQLAMLLPAWAFWSAVLRPGADGQEALQRAVLIGGFAAVMGFVGAILTFSPRLLYIQHVEGAAAWGLDPLADQQLAGLVMWVPGFLPVAAIGFAMLHLGWRRSFAA